MDSNLFSILTQHFSNKYVMNGIGARIIDNGYEAFADNPNSDDVKSFY